MATPRAPNLLLVISDQQRTDTMSCYGNDWIASPHHDALAAGSFVFDHAYCTQPVCTPARGSLMTGLYPHDHGCVVNNTGPRPETRSLAEWLPDGYRKAHVGKWHLGDDAFCQKGFDDWISVEDHRRRRYSRPDPPFWDLHRWLVDRGRTPASPLPGGEAHFGPAQRAGLPAEEQMGAFVAGRADAFIRAHIDEPWLLVVSTYEPHPPYTGPHDDLYDPATLPVGPAFGRYPAGHSRFARSRADFFPTTSVDGQDLRTEAGRRALRARYFGNVKIVDDAVGVLLAALAETGQAGRTAIAFTSDHGELAGDHRMWGKRVLYDPSARVPLLLRVPWLSDEMRRVRGVASHVDLVPTLLELAGAQVPESLPGRSLLPALTGAWDLRGHQAVVEWNGVGRAQAGGCLHDVADGIVRDRNLGSGPINTASAHAWRSLVTGDRWKLNLCTEDRCELFDLANDPHELRNRIDDPACAERVTELTARLRRWQADTGDDAPLPAP